MDSEGLRFPCEGQTIEFDVLPLVRAKGSNPRGLASSDVNEVPTVQSVHRGSDCHAYTSSDLHAFSNCS